MSFGDKQKWNGPFHISISSLTLVLALNRYVCHHVRTSAGSSLHCLGPALSTQSQFCVFINCFVRSLTLFRFFLVTCELYLLSVIFFLRFLRQVRYMSFFFFLATKRITYEDVKIIKKYIDIFHSCCLNHKNQSTWYGDYMNSIL